MEQNTITLTTKDLLTPGQAAEYLGVTKMSLWRWARDGKIAQIMLDHAYFHINEVERVKKERCK